jgi:Fe-S-cluster containining protein
MSACTGTCCVAFYLRRPSTNPVVLEMLLPIDRDEAEQRHRALGDLSVAADLSAGTATEEGDGQWYKCKNWDEDTRLCTIYDTRPTMCRDYPYEKGCPSCSFESDPETVERYIQIHAVTN